MFYSNKLIECESFPVSRTTPAALPGLRWRKIYREGWAYRVETDEANILLLWSHNLGVSLVTGCDSNELYNVIRYYLKSNKIGM